MEMALDGLTGNDRQSFISREEMRRRALAHGKKRSLRENPQATVFGKAANDAS